MTVKRLRKCPKCRRYMLQEACKKCGVNTHSPHPPRFSLDDPFLEYRVKALIESMGKTEK